MIKSHNHEKQYVLFYDQDKCTGCMYCMLACSFKHYGVFDFKKSFITIVEELNNENKFIGAFCAHCNDPICKASCPTKAIIKDDVTGIVRINWIDCILCRNCEIACPISNPKMDFEKGSAVKCDLCDGNPACVRLCPSGAITLIDREGARKLIEKAF
ncbi:MAG: 4Fe-4S dicluster domain-containing protein [Candidatus Bathyarchaeia archaeon]